MFAKKYQIKTGESTRYEVPFNFGSCEKICDLYEEKLADKRFGRTREVGISIVENRRIIGSKAILRKHMNQKRLDVVTRAMENLDKEIGGRTFWKKGHSVPNLMLTTFAGRFSCILPPHVIILN
jgi:hypothetical protein